MRAADTATATTERAAFFTEEQFAPGSHVILHESDARHIQVLRLGVGERVALRNGAGKTGSGLLVRLARTQALVEVDEEGEVAPPPAIHLMLPVADRDRMLWLAEKAAELNVASWRPVLWHRSRSVSPRGDGVTFRQKVRGRMIAAMLQSRSAWLPEIYPEANPERAIAAAPAGCRLVLNATGEPPVANMFQAPATLAIGPEGGFEPAELDALRAAGFTPASIGRSVLRFETAAVAAVAVARTMLTISGLGDLPTIF